MSTVPPPGHRIGSTNTNERVRRDGVEPPGPGGACSTGTGAHQCPVDASRFASISPFRRLESNQRPPRPGRGVATSGNHSGSSSGRRGGRTAHRSAAFEADAEAPGAGIEPAGSSLTGRRVNQLTPPRSACEHIRVIEAASGSRTRTSASARRQAPATSWPRRAGGSTDRDDFDPRPRRTSRQTRRGGSKFARRSRFSGDRQAERARTALRKIRRPSASRSRPRRVQRGWWSGSTKRSGWGIRPKTRPVGSQRPATAPGEPPGLAG